MNVRIKFFSTVAGGAMKCLVIALSMMAPFILVNASAEDSPSVNHEAKAKGIKNDLPRLIQTVSNTGDQKDFPNGYAQAVGLSEAMPAKRCHVVLSGDDKAWEDRHVFVVYSNDEPTRPYCVYLMRGHASKHVLKQEFFRVSLDGKLEKAIMLQNKRDDDGNSIAEGRSRFEEDQDDPAVQKTFQTELSYWLKTWLKKQPKGASEASAPATAAGK
jgi:hypothetical protein